MQDKDEIMILPHANVVIVAGEVNKSGIHKYVPGKRLNYYLDLAGGLSQNADKNYIWVDYPNGDSKRMKKWSIRGPKILDGSTINIGKKKDEEPFDKTEYAKELTAIFTNIAQVIAIMSLAR